MSWNTADRKLPLTCPSWLFLSSTIPFSLTKANLKPGFQLWNFLVSSNCKTEEVHPTFPPYHSTHTSMYWNSNTEKSEHQKKDKCCSKNNAKYFLGVSSLCKGRNIFVSYLLSTDTYFFLQVHYLFVSAGMSQEESCCFTHCRFPREKGVS